MNLFGVPKFQTPDALPGDRQCRSLSIPDDAQWLAAINGVLFLLANPALWEQADPEALSPEECALFANEMFEQYIASARLGACDMPTVPPPEVYIAQTLPDPPFGNIASEAATWYNLTFADELQPQDWAGHNPSTGLLWLNGGVYRVQATSYNGTPGASKLRFGLYDESLWMAEFPFSYNNNPAGMEWWVTNPSAGSVDLVVQQYFAQAAAGGRQTAGSTTYVVNRLMIERYAYIG